MLAKAKPSSPAQALCSDINSSCTIPCYSLCRGTPQEEVSWHGLGMALLHLTNDVHMWLLFVLCSLILPFPPKPFPGQVCSWVHLMAPGQLLSLVLLSLQDDVPGSAVPGAGSVPCSPCCVPSAESCPLRSIPPSPAMQARWGLVPRARTGCEQEL